MANPGITAESTRSKSKKNKDSKKTTTRKSSKDTDVQKVRLDVKVEMSGSAPTPQPFNALASKSSGTLVEHAPLFSPDSKYLMTAFADFVRVHSVQTGDCVRMISLNSEKQNEIRVVSMAINPKNSFQLYVATSNGQITLWDYLDGVQLKSFDTGCSGVTSMQPCYEQAHVVFLAVESKENEEIKSKLYRVHLETLTKRKMFKLSGSIQFILHPQKPLLAALCDKEVILSHWQSGDDEESVAVLRFSHDRKLKTLAFHPNDMILATGDSRGQINLWHYEELLSGEKKNVVKRPPFTKLHWHSQSVNSISFTADGHYLLSGGDEAVLVVWQLETGHKDFLPRLVAPIGHVASSPDQLLFVLALHDNTIQIVTSVDLKIQKSITGIKAFGNWEQPMNRLQCHGGGLICEPRSGYLVLNGAPGCLQFWNTTTNKHVFEVEVAPKSRVYKNDSGIVPTSIIQHVAFSADGMWMATIDQMESKQESDDSLKKMSECFLKFWKWCVNSNSFRLITRIDQPHSKLVTRLTFHPQGVPLALNNGTIEYLPLCVTSSLDESFKLWQLSVPEKALPSIAQRKSKQKHEHRQELIQTWYCRSTGVWRALPVNDVIFSGDGSLLCVAYGHLITLWNPLSLQFHGILSNQFTGPIKQMLFTQSTDQMKSRNHFLAVHFDTGLCIWNCITGRLEWQLPGLDVRHLITSNGFFMVIAKHNQDSSKSILLMFDPVDPQPVLKMILDDDVLAIQSFSNERLIYMTSRNTLTTLSLTEPEESLESLPSSTAQPDVSGLFSSIYGSQWKTKSKTTIENELFNRPAPVQPTDFSVLEAPSHVIPPVGKIYRSFMRNMLRPKPVLESVPDALKEQTLMEESSSSSYETVSVKTPVSQPSWTDVNSQPVECLSQLLHSRCSLQKHSIKDADLQWTNDVLIG